MSPSNVLLSTLRRQCAPESHLARLANLVSLAEADSRLLALFLVGSYAKGVGDRVSDLDLVAIASSGHGESVLQAGHELLSRSEMLNQFAGTHPGGGSFWKLVYLDFSSVEFYVFEPGTTFRLKRPYLSVWDPTNLRTSLVAEGEPIRQTDFAAYEYGDEGLIWELVDCIKWLSRGHNELAKDYIRKLAAEFANRESGR
jgi:hypothetical protein